jgi:hypothetical protein
MVFNSCRADMRSFNCKVSVPSSEGHKVQLEKPPVDSQSLVQAQFSGSHTASSISLPIGSDQQSFFSRPEREYNRQPSSIWLTSLNFIAPLPETDIELGFVVDDTSLQYRHDINKVKAIVLQSAQKVGMRLNNAILHAVPQ